MPQVRAFRCAQRRERNPLTTHELLQLECPAYGQGGTLPVPGVSAPRQPGQAGEFALDALAEFAGAEDPGRNRAQTFGVGRRSDAGERDVTRTSPTCESVSPIAGCRR